MSRVRSALCCWFLLVSPSLAAEATFAVKPSVVATDEGATITFAASAATDVEVAVLDAGGKVVRHLAAGCLGANAPAPLQKNSLEQTLKWDGKNNLGQPATGGPFSVRVALGLKPELGGFLGDNPAALDSVRALATGPRGEVFVFQVFGTISSGDGTLACTVFDREGKYLRTILPYPANSSEEGLKGIKRLTLEDGSKVPFLYQAETRSLLPGTGELPAVRPIVSSDGRLAFVGIQEGPHRGAGAGINQVLVIGTDGSLPAEGCLRTVLSKSSGGSANLALSPDEKTIYASGMRFGSGSKSTSNHAIFRFGWSDKEPRIFVGEEKVPGKDEKHLDTPCGIAVDKEGNVLVADRGNNRVAVFKADGGFLGALEVERPERVEVHPKTGAIYVIAGPQVNRLLKFAAWDKPEPVAELKLPTFKHRLYTAVMALDASAEPPVLWVSSRMGHYAKMNLLRIEDRGTAFSKPVDTGLRAKNAKPTAGVVMGMDLDRRRQRLFVNAQIYDLKTQEWREGIREATGTSTGSRGAGSMGLDGNFYSQIHPQISRRIGPDLKKLPFAATPPESKGDLLNPIKGAMRVRGRGITANAQGNVFILWEDQLDATRGEAFNHLYVYNPDGSLKKAKLLDSGIRSVNSVRVDYAGNVYVALGLRPGTDLLPPGLKGQIPASPQDPDAVNGVNCYPLLYGSIAKFSPAGGTIRPDCGGVAANYAWGVPIQVKGAEWIFSGTSPVVSWRVPGTGTPDICNCESPRFDVDPYGRSFFTDAARFRVGMLDTSGNLIGWFGSYGNVDSAGPGSKIPVPAIPLYWPYNISVDDDHVYVGDRFNRRVVQVKLAHAAMETVKIPAR